MIRVQQVGGSLVNAVGIGTQQTSGPLCVCRTTDEVPQKFRSGDVLVVPYTTNDMLPYLRARRRRSSARRPAPIATRRRWGFLESPSCSTRRMRRGGSRTG